jgi:ABC-type multidrug transport system fused ATPase/permease subunit
MFQKDKLNTLFESVQVVAILLNYCLQLQDDLVRYLLMRSNFENDMVGQERCLSYTTIKSEAPNVLLTDQNLVNWPSNGVIEFQNYYVRYRPDTEIVLKDLNFTIEASEKIGVVGRTGSGKSTIALCLFRILEPLKGRILIDNVDISEIGLSKLRSSITIIPKDPTLMEGSLRFNIDPLHNHSDNEIEEVMKKIGFWYMVENYLAENKDKNVNGLDMIIKEDGGNISIGEKQLICITRAILRKSKIIVMDEATASIDVKTERLIQNAINELLFNSTTFTIAHRIKTILNSDRILVLEKGEIAEFDSPQNLIENKNSLFYQLYKKSKV